MTDSQRSIAAGEASASGHPFSLPVSRAAIAGLILLTLLGAYFRLDGLDRKSISHPELFVPGIELPQEHSVPRPRMTLAKVLSGTYSADVHPPGYYVMMLAWTKLFGASTVSIRLPGALLGVVSIPLLFWVGRLTGHARAGWIAAALLAANGDHIYYSQYARMFSLACAVGLLATGLLLLLARGRGPRRLLEVAYVMTIVLGVNTHVFFWTLFLAQMVWTIGNSPSRGQELPSLLRWQVLALILGLPALAFSIYQSAAPVAALSQAVFPFVREFVSFSFLFPLRGFPESQATWQTPFAGSDFVSMAWRYALFTLSLTFIVAGLLALKGARTQEPEVERGKPSRLACFVAAGLSSFSIGAFVLVARRELGANAHSTLRATAAMIAVPPLIAWLAPVVYRLWDRAPERARAILENPFSQGGAELLAVQGWLPFAVIALTSLHRPLLNQRGLLFVAPYLLFLLAAGMLAVAKARWVQVAVAGGLILCHAGSVAAYGQMPLSITDYKAFAEKVIPRVHSSDLVLFWPNWYSSPIYFYMKPHEFAFAGADFAAACQKSPDANVVVLLFRGNPMNPEIKSALADYRQTDAIYSGRETALFYTRTNSPKTQENATTPVR